MRWKWLGPALVVAALIVTAALYPRLPTRLPTHWGLSGEPDAWGDKRWAAFIGPLAAGGSWLLLVALRRVDPRRAHYERFEDTFWLVVNLLVLLLLTFQALALASGLGWSVDMGRTVMAVLGVLMMALGNYLPRLRSNWWMGIRTPWTLESESVWRKTHRLGGRLLVLSGALTLLALPLPAWRAAVLPTTVVLSMAAAVIYSYFAWRRERAGGPRHEREEA